MQPSWHLCLTTLTGTCLTLALQPAACYPKSSELRHILQHIHPLRTPLGGPLSYFTPTQVQQEKRGGGEDYSSHARVVHKATRCDGASHVALEQGTALCAARVAAEHTAGHHAHRVSLCHGSSRLTSRVEGEVAGCDV